MAQTKVQLLQPDLGDVIDFDASTLFVDGADNRIGIRNTNPQYELDVTGTINATNFRGNISTGTIDDWITHTGDTNTKFGFPAADTYTVETAGSERLRIASDGHVRVGSGDPQYEFELVGAGSQHILIGSTDANGAVLILDGDSNGDGTGSDYATVLHSTAGNLEYHNRKTADHIFKIGTSNEEKLRITSTGVVSINDSTPETWATLQVKNLSLIHI